MQVLPRLRGCAAPFCVGRLSRLHVTIVHNGLRARLNVVETCDVLTGFVDVARTKRPKLRDNCAHRAASEPLQVRADVRSSRTKRRLGPRLVRDSTISRSGELGSEVEHSIIRGVAPRLQC